MKAWEIVAYVDFDACVVYCDDCGVDGRHHPIFAVNAEDELEDGEVCARCHSVWHNEWFLDKANVFDVMREAIDDDG